MQIKHVCVMAIVCVSSMIVDVIMAGDIEKKLAAVSSKLEQDFERARLQYAMAQETLDNLLVKTLTFPKCKVLRQQCTNAIATHKLLQGFNQRGKHELIGEIAIAFADQELERDTGFDEAIGLLGLEKVVAAGLHEASGASPSEEAVNNGVVEVRNLIASLAYEYPPTPGRLLERQWSWSSEEFRMAHDARPVAAAARMKRSISQ